MSGRREVLLGGIAAAIAASLGGNNELAASTYTPLRGGSPARPIDTGRVIIPPDCESTVPADSREKILDDVDADLESIDISDGRVPFPRQTDAWKKIISDFGQQYSPFNQATLQQVSEHDYLRAPFHPAALYVDSAFTFNSDNKSFRPQHADVLLNQAADILDRCLRDRLEWEDKQTKWASLALEILDFLQRDEIHSREIEAGLYTTPAKEAEYEREARARAYQAMVAGNQWLEVLLNSPFHEDSFKELLGTEQLIAWLNVIGGNQADKQVEWNSTKKKATEFAKDAAVKLTDFNFHTQKYQLLTTWFRCDWERAAAGYSEMASAERHRWLVRDIAFQRERSKQARRLVDLKVRLATEKGGAFNYREKMDCVSSRIARDFADALARLKAVEAGLKQIFGYDHPVPNNLRMLLENPNNNSSVPGDACYLDDLVAWVRDAIAWLIRFSGLDQSYVLTLSVRQHVSEAAWHDGLQTGRWSFTLSEGDTGDFPNYQSLRLAGLSASVSGKDLKGIWQATVRLPLTGTYIHGESKSVVDQSDISICRLGRVGTRQLIQFPDVTGRSSLRNASPLGDWQVSLGAQSTRGEKRKDIEDVEIDLEVIHQWA